MMNEQLSQALSRLAGNRHSDGTSSLVSSEDRNIIIDGWHALTIAARRPHAPEEATQLDLVGGPPISNVSDLLAEGVRAHQTLCRGLDGQATETRTLVGDLTAALARSAPSVTERNVCRLLSLMQDRPTDRHKLTYTNYRGETSVRELHLVRVWFGGTDWHPEPQLLLRAFDYGKDAYRDFAVIDFALGDGPSRQPELGPAL